MTFMLSFGKWGGIYWRNGWAKRLCLGWIALTFWPNDLDVILLAEVEALEQKAELEEAK